MNYYLIRLKFTAPVRFGSDEPGAGLETCQYFAHADTFFSALALEFYQRFGETAWKGLWDAARAGELLISDLMPYADVELFIPRPSLVLKRSGEATAEQDGDRRLKKKLKDLKFLPITQLDKYLKFLLTGEHFTPVNYTFGQEALNIKVALRQGEESLPYYVSVYHFYYQTAAEPGKPGLKNGLYFIAGFEKDAEARLYEQFIDALHSLGSGGIGGKRTAGYGRFELEDDPALLDGEYPVYGGADLLLGKLLRRDGDYYLAVAPVIPAADELTEETWQGSWYTLLPRQGFALPGEPQITPRKKKPVVAFAPGSCFSRRLAGTVQDVTPEGYTHRVYRYGKGLYLGIKLPEVGS